MASKPTCLNDLKNKPPEHCELISDVSPAMISESEDETFSEFEPASSKSIIIGKYKKKTATTFCSSSQPEADDLLLSSSESIIQCAQPRQDSSNVSYHGNVIHPEITNMTCESEQLKSSAFSSSLPAIGDNIVSTIDKDSNNNNFVLPLLDYQDNSSSNNNNSSRSRSHSTSHESFVYTIYNKIIVY